MKSQRCRDDSYSVNHKREFMLFQTTDGGSPVPLGEIYKCKERAEADAKTRNEVFREQDLDGYVRVREI